MNNKQAQLFQTRNKKLDVYKGLLIVFVVIRHVLQYSVSDEGGILTNFIWALQMPGFMLVAGYFSARQIESVGEAGKRILLSAQHYALPFFSWFLLVKVFLLGSFDRNPILGLGELLQHVDGGLWFLWVVFVLSIVATLANLCLSSCKRKIIKTCSVFIICLGILVTIWHFFGINFLGIKYILYYAIFYGFGWLVKWTAPWWTKWWPKVRSIVIFISLLVFLFIIFNYDLYHTNDGVISFTLRYFAGFAGNIVLLAIIDKNEELFKKVKLDKLGMYTLEIYVTHVCVYNLIDMGQSLYTLAGLATFVCSLMFTIVFTVLIIITIKSNPVSDFIFYGKKKRNS